jgi:hypothetical protein
MIRITRYPITFGVILLVFIKCNFRLLVYIAMCMNLHIAHCTASSLGDLCGMEWWLRWDRSCRSLIVTSSLIWGHIYMLAHQSTDLLTIPYYQSDQFIYNEWIHSSITKWQASNSEHDHRSGDSWGKVSLPSFYSDSSLRVSLLGNRCCTSHITQNEIRYTE